MKKIPLLAAIIILAISLLIPESIYFSSQGIRTVGLVFVFLVLLVTEAMPISVVCWTVLGLMPVIGVTSNFGEALFGFSNPVAFFILASFGISAAFTTLPLSKRILVILLKKFGKSMKSFLFVFMLCILPISAFVSSVPTAAMFMAIGLSFIDMFEDEKAKRATGKTFMIAIPVICLIGGMATPVGSVINILAIDLLEQHTGMTISFVQWMSIGIPMVLLILPVAWLLIYKIYKPTEICSEMVKAFVAKLDVPQKMMKEEKRVLAIMGIMVFLWILSSWVVQIDVVIVALLGACVMFFLKILEWKPFIKNVNFDAFFLVGTVLSLGVAMGTNGVSDWIVTLFPTGYMALPTLVAFTVTIVFAILIIMPVGPSVVMFLAVPLMVLAQSAGHSPALIILVLAMAAGNCYLLPLDTIPLITYSSGRYSMLDMPKSTLPLQIYVIIILTLVMWLAGGLLGII